PRKASESLARLGAPASAELVRLVLQDRKLRAQHGALLNAAGAAIDAKALPGLLELLGAKDATPLLRLDVAHAIEKVHALAAVPHLARILKDPIAGDAASSAIAACFQGATPASAGWKDAVASITSILEQAPFGGEPAEAKRAGLAYTRIVAAATREALPELGPNWSRDGV